MNTTDEALLLFRRLQAEYQGVRYTKTQAARRARLARVKYQVYRRWKRRDAELPGTIRPTLSGRA